MFDIVVYQCRTMCVLAINKTTDRMCVLVGVRDRDIESTFRNEIRLIASKHVAHVVVCTEQSKDECLEI